MSKRIAVRRELVCADNETGAVGRASEAAMQRTNKLIAYSLISGCVWAGVGLAIAWLISPVSPVRTPLPGVAQRFGGGLVAAPAIGLLIGLLSRNFSAFGRSARIAIALADVYLASFLFLMAVNVFKTFAGEVAGSQFLPAVVSGPIFGAVFGLTYTGIVFVLWPLSYANHSLIGRIWKRS